MNVNMRVRVAEQYAKGARGVCWGQKNHVLTASGKSLCGGVPILNGRDRHPMVGFYNEPPSPTAGHTCLKCAKAEGRGEN